MTQRTKVIVGVVVVLGAYYLYDRNKKMKAVADLKAGAEVKSDVTKEPLSGGDRSTLEPVGTGGVKPSTIVKTTASVDAQKELNFAGSRGNSMTAQYYR